MTVTGVHLITGLIGSGKTLRAVSIIDAEVKAGRAVYVCNINGLNIPGVIPFEDPRQWQDLPPGALLVVDEAQKWWRARRSADVPPELQAMETSRHDAVSFLLMTQQPTYLDKHLRGLIGRHEHLFRRGGAQAASLYAWDRVHEDPMSSTSKDGADETVFLYPKRLFDAYKSSEQHTVKFRISTRMKMVAVAVVALASILGYLYVDMSKAAKPDAAIVGADDAATPQASRHVGPPPAMATPEQYLAQQVPRLATQPWSAPQFDSANKVKSDPAVYCMASGDDMRDSCTCMTEQATRYRLANDDATHDARCRDMARHGPAYNPFKAPKRETPQQRLQERQRGRDASPTIAALPQPGAPAYGDLAPRDGLAPVGDMAGIGN